jgi:hypothetical protein
MIRLSNSRESIASSGALTRAETGNPVTAGPQQMRLHPIGTGSSGQGNGRVLEVQQLDMSIVTEPTREIDRK